MNTSKQRWIAGIGSRKTPYSIIPTIDRIVKRLSELGYGIRSGGAIGADRYFETAARKYNTPLEIFVPFQRHHPDHITWYDVPYEQRRDALALAERFHPNWSAVKPEYRKIHARNGFQIFGQTLKDPVDFVVCWTSDSQLDEQGQICNAVGGTGQAIRIAYAYQIPVYNLNIESSLKQLEERLK